MAKAPKVTLPQDIKSYGDALQHISSSDTFGTGNAATMAKYKITTADEKALNVLFTEASKSDKHAQRFLRDLRDIEATTGRDLRGEISALEKWGAGIENDAIKAFKKQPLLKKAWNSKDGLAEQLKEVGAGGKKVIDTTHKKADTRLDEQFEKYKPHDYASEVGFKKKLNGNLRSKKGDGGLEVRTDGELAKLESKINDLHGDMERARESLGQTWNADAKAQKQIQGEITKIEKELEKVGKQAQKVAHESIKGDAEWIRGLGKEHGEVLNKLKKRQNKILDALDEIEVKKIATTGGGKAPIARFREELGKDLKIKFEDKIYHITDHGGIIEEGGAAIKKPGQIKEIISAAKDQVEAQFENSINRHKDAFERIQEHVKERAEHVGNLKSEFSTKTKIGEFTGKVASKTTPGGVQAASKGVMTEAEYEAKGMMGKIGADVNANMKKSFMGKAQVLCGGILVGKGLMDAYKGGSAMLSSDPEKKEEAGAGTLVMGIAEVAGGSILARLGGKAAALGGSRA